jgi:polyphosphate kinase 2 (PPK2 family)
MNLSDPDQLDRIKAEIADSFDEELELQMDEDRLDDLVADGKHPTAGNLLDRKIYFQDLFRLQHELVRLQDWVQHQKLKVVVIFEGRDSAGKGGAIKRVTQRLNPRVCRVVALPAPSERERHQWYFQRYVQHLPTAGEIVLFDRSWYNQSVRRSVDQSLGPLPSRHFTCLHRRQTVYVLPEYIRIRLRTAGASAAGQRVIVGC